MRALYETLEVRFNGRSWSRPELMIGFANEVGHIGRLILAHAGTWPIEGDVTAELEHKLAESLWWTIVLADKLDIDLTRAFGVTMDTIRAGLPATIDRTGPRAATERGASRAVTRRESAPSPSRIARIRALEQIGA